jgi:hypothetical protein
MHRAEVIAHKFGNWTVVQDLPRRAGGRYVVAKCDCGTVKEVFLGNLTCGASKSCGCVTTQKLVSKNTKHSKTGTKAFNAWASMRGRCNNQSNKAYSDYGGIGVMVCARWDDFVLFLADMGEPFLADMTLDRINVDGDYEPSNCRWVQQTLQVNNTRANVYVNWFGSKVSLATAHSESGTSTPYKTVHNRFVKSAWALTDALWKPSRMHASQWANTNNTCMGVV